MPLRLLFLLSLFFPCSIAAQKQVCVIDADTQQPIGNVVITNTQTGKILGVTRENGLYTVEPQTQRLSFSHLSYLPLQAQPADTIRMRPHNYPLSSPQVTAQAADYYRLRAVVRNYQYIDSLPVNFVDAIIDFYVNGKGNKLEYQIIKLDAYRDKQSIRENNLNRSRLEMSSNGLLDWIRNHHVSTRNSDFIMQQVGDHKTISLKKNGELLGTLFFDKAKNEYVAKINLMTPRDTATRSFFGRHIKFNLHTLEEHFPSTVDTAQLRPYDMKSYRWILQRDTWTKRYPTRVPLTEIHEILILERRRLTKEEYKKQHFDTDWLDFSNSIRGRAASEHIDLTPYVLPLPKNIEALLGKELEQLPYKD